MGLCESGSNEFGVWSLLEPGWDSTESGADCAIWEASDPGPLGSGVGVAGACAGSIDGPGAATGEACAGKTGDTKADAEPSVLGGSKAPYSSGRQPFHAGSARDNSVGSEKYS